MAAMAIRVNGELIQDEALAREAESVRQRLEQLSPAQREEMGLDEAGIRQRAVEWGRENLIEQTLLRQQACTDPRPVDEDAAEKIFVEALKRHGGAKKLAEAGLDEGALRGDICTQLKVERLVAAVTAKARPPKPKELAQAYRRNKQRFTTEEMVRASHIVKHIEKGVTEEQAKDAADQIYKRLQSGEAFERLADEVSDCPGGGGDLGYFSRGKMVSEFEEIVFGMQVGGVSEVFKTVFGFHIVKLTDRKPAGVRPFAQVQDELVREALEDRRRKLVEQYLDGLREQAAVEDVPSSATGP